VERARPARGNVGHAAHEAAAVWANALWSDGLSGRGVLGFRSGSGFGGLCWRGLGDKLAAALDIVAAVAPGEEAIVADAVKAVGKDVQQEATNELVDLEP